LGSVDAATQWQSPLGGPAPADAPWLPRPGEVIAGRFRVERTIGEGGMGAVVAAENVGMGGKVAIKFLHPHLAVEGEAHERFIREAKVAAQIRSEHVVRVLDVGKTERGLPYIVMDLLEGADLGRVLERGPMPIPLAVDCVLQASEALAEAHAQGIVHRDIKPANHWLAQRRDGSPSVKVLDFGISKLMPSDRQAAGITDTKASFGSPAYMSPEQIRSAKRVDHRTDVFALGIVLFELLTRKLPFDADSVAGILAAIISDPPQSLGRLRPDAPPELERIVRKMIEKDPGHRYSLAEVAAGLRPFATPAGQLAADRLVHMGTPIPSLIPPPDGTPRSSEDMIALGKTEPSLVRSSPVASSSTLLIGVLIGLVAALVVGGVATYAVLARRSAPPPSEIVVEAPPPPPPVVEPVVTIAAPAVAAVPSASVSAAPSATAPKAPVLKPAKRPAPATSAPLIYEDRKAW
jgi:serine/threonine-protein kinase